MYLINHVSAEADNMSFCVYPKSKTGSYRKRKITKQQINSYWIVILADFTRL